MQLHFQARQGHLAQDLRGNVNKERRVELEELQQDQALALALIIPYRP